MRERKIMPEDITYENFKEKFLACDEKDRLAFLQSQEPGFIRLFFEDDIVFNHILESGPTTNIVEFLFALPEDARDAFKTILVGGFEGGLQWYFPLNKTGEHRFKRCYAHIKNDDAKLKIFRAWLGDSLIQSIVPDMKHSRSDMPFFMYLRETSEKMNFLTWLGSHVISSFSAKLIKGLLFDNNYFPENSSNMEFIKIFASEVAYVLIRDGKDQKYLSKCFSDSEFKEIKSILEKAVPLENFFQTKITNLMFVDKKKKSVTFSPEAKTGDEESKIMKRAPVKFL